MCHLGDIPDTPEEIKVARKMGLIRKRRKFWSKYGSRKVYIKSLKRHVYFCKKCGEYITENTGCSNPFCPEEMSDYGDGMSLYY